MDPVEILDGLLPHPSNIINALHCGLACPVWSHLMHAISRPLVTQNQIKTLPALPNQRASPTTWTLTKRVNIPDDMTGRAGMGSSVGDHGGRTGRVHEDQE